MRRLAPLVVLLLVAACRDGVGSPCRTHADCRFLGPSAVCLTAFPRGYCTLPCEHDADCPEDPEAICAIERPARYCALRCGGDWGCRSGYLCAPVSGDVRACLP